MGDINNKRTAVYRWYDADGNLLYVGMTVNILVPDGVFPHPTTGEDD